MEKSAEIFKVWKNFCTKKDEKELDSLPWKINYLGKYRGDL